MMKPQLSSRQSSEETDQVAFIGLSIEKEREEKRQQAKDKSTGYS